MASATPRPHGFRIDREHKSDMAGGVVVVDADGEFLCDCAEEESATHIVRCMNAHAGLVEALEVILDQLDGPPTQMIGQVFDGRELERARAALREAGEIEPEGLHGWERQEDVPGYAGVSYLVTHRDGSTEVCATKAEAIAALREAGEE